jgi:hypothetical protein
MPCSALPFAREWQEFPNRPAHRLGRGGCLDMAAQEIPEPLHRLA